MLDPKLTNEIILAARDPFLALSEILSAPGISVVALGERHVAQNPQRRLGVDLMKRSEARYISTLALELTQTAQKDLHNFNRGMLVDLPEALKHYSASLYCADQKDSMKIDSRPDPFFFGMLNAARAAG